MKNKIIELRQLGYSYNDISKNLNISKGVISYHLKSVQLNTPKNNLGVKLSNDIILKIGELYKNKLSKKEIAKKLNLSYGSVKKYTEKKTIQTQTSEEQKQKIYTKNKNWRTNLKLKCVLYLGGKCAVCGYNKCLGALDLHHKNENEKEFTISGGNLKSFEKLIPELNKCDVLCSNCHRELHNPHLINLL